MERSVLGPIVLFMLLVPNQAQVPVVPPQSQTTLSATTAQPPTTNQTTARANLLTENLTNNVTTIPPAATSNVTEPLTIMNNCSVTVPAGRNCLQFGQQRCGPGTAFDIDMCVCNHINQVDPITCKTIVMPEFIPNNCNVKVRAGIECKTFGPLTCPMWTAYDIKLCLCNHQRNVNFTTCSS